MKKLPVFVLLIISVLSGCSTDTGNPDSSSSLGQTSANGHLSSVKLDGEKKWRANPETTEGIHKMKDMLATVHAEGSLEEHRALQSDLENEFNGILQKCTMKGEAHNQLHNYLMPLNDMIKKSGSDLTSDRTKAIAEIDTHLKAYETYFQ
jgi:hypothetical protein